MTDSEIYMLMAMRAGSHAERMFWTNKMMKKITYDIQKALSELPKNVQDKLLKP